MVYLDQISDPGNLGTIIRTCDWFGIKQIGISLNSVEFYNPKVVRSSMGSHFNMKYLGTPSSEDLNRLNLIGANFNKGKDINDISNPKTVFIIKKAYRDFTLYALNSLKKVIAKLYL